MNERADTFSAFDRPWSYVVLTKPDVTFLVVLTTIAGFYLGSRGPLDWVLMLHTLGGTLLVAGGTSALNQYVERDMDALMRRTAARQVETGSAITWKYPSCILLGDNAVGEFYSVAVTNNYQQADTGTKMIHIGKNTRSTIVAKGISAGHGQNSYRGLVKIQKGASQARNFSQCDSLLLGDKCGAHTFPYIEVKNTTARVEHEASTSKIGEDQIFYCNQRGLATQDAVNMIVNGFCKEVFRELPMEFAVEAQKLLGVSLEGSVG